MGSGVLPGGRGRKTLRKSNMFRITVRLTASIARHAGNQKILLYKIEDKCDLSDLIDFMGKDFSGLKNHLCTKEGQLIDSVNVYC